MSILVNLSHNPLWYSMLISQWESCSIFQPHSYDRFDRVLQEADQGHLSGSEDFS